MNFRARGGSDEDGNLVSLCACHHLRAIHGGYLGVRGTAPDRLVWEVGGRPFRAGAMEELRDEARAA